MPKKVLIVTHGFYPELSPRSFRATELAKEFCRQGIETTVMAPEREGVEKLLKEYPIIFKSLGPTTWKVFNFKGLGPVGRLYNKAANRLLPLLLEYPWIEMFFKIKKALAKEKNNYDLLISVAVPYPVHWGVASVWRKGKQNCAKVWVADCGDPYCFQENDTFKPPFYFRWIEKWFMRKTDHVAVPTSNSYKGYFPEFHSKISVIPQGFHFGDIQKRPVINDGVIRFGYGGAFILDRRDPRELLTYLSGLPAEKKFEFHIYTNNAHFVQPFAEKDKRIILHKPVDRVNLLETMSSFQFVVNFANVGITQTPSKLIDYAIIDKPILNVETGNLKTSIVDAFFNGDYSQSLPVNNIEQFKIENVAAQFLSLTKS